jgi:hypothetical protein
MDQGLYAVRQKYFASFFLTHDLFGVLPVPLPGVHLLLVLLFINLVCGGLIRMGKSLSRVGVLIGHLGIAFLLVSGFVAFQCSTTGEIVLYEGERANEFQCYDAWEIAVCEGPGDGPVTEYVIPDGDAVRLEGDASATFYAKPIPFDVVVHGYVRNAVPMAVGGAAEGRGVVDGFRLVSQPPFPEPERNVPGTYVTLVETGSGAVHEGILWGEALYPLSVEVAGTPWMVDLHRRRFTLPFEVELKRFTRELHPGSAIPKAFTSEVVCRYADGQGREFTISMNRPLRERGYTLYQSGWGPDGAESGSRPYSVLAVVRNPAERLPLYAALLIAFGLLVHFIRKLLCHLTATAREGRT